MTTLNEQHNIIKKYLVIMTLLFLTACGGGGDSGNATINISKAVNGITSTTPINNASKIPVSINKITVNFSKEIDPNTLNINTFSVSNGVTGTINITKGNTQATFTPNTPLLSNMTYTVSLNGITDSAGSSMLPNNAQTFSWLFTTCGSIPATTYSISWTAVSDGDLSGYKVYYGTSTPLTKANSTAVSLGNVTSWILNPTNLSLSPCDNVQIAVSSVGNTKSESSLSQAGTIIID